MTFGLGLPDIETMAGENTFCTRASLLVFVVLASGSSFEDIISVKLANTQTPIHKGATCKLTSYSAVNDKFMKACQRTRQDFNGALLAAAIACC